MNVNIRDDWKRDKQTNKQTIKIVINLSVDRAIN